MNNINESIKNTYDEIPYRSNCFYFLNTEFLRNHTKIFNLNFETKKDIRVLEIGCSFGANVIAQAVYNPNGYYLGIDLSEYQIAEGKKIIDQIGLKNVELVNLDILDFDYEKYGKFDYILCHGVFSWVPLIVREKILEISRKALNENGLAFISFNTYPGWKKMSTIRDIMLYANKYHENLEPNEQIRRSRILLNNFKNEMLKFNNEKYFIETIERVLDKNDYYLQHEYLDHFNEPYYLYEFQEMLDKQDLRHLTDTNFQLSFSSLYGSETYENIKTLSNDDPVIKGTVIDFIRSTTFRKSVIGHKEFIDKANFKEEVKNSIVETYFVKNKSKMENSLFDFEGFYTLEDVKKRYMNTKEYKKLSEEDKVKKLENLNSTFLFNIINEQVYLRDENIYIENLKENLSKYKVREEIVNYYKYFSAVDYENSKISFGNLFLENIKINQWNYEIVKNINGKTYEEIFDILKDKLQKEGLQFRNIVDGKEVILDFDKSLSNYINEELNRLCYSSILEEV